jgi:hypothetical protein
VQARSLDRCSVVGQICSKTEHSLPPRREDSKASMVALLVVTLLEVCKQVGQILVLEPFFEALRHQR